MDAFFLFRPCRTPQQKMTRVACLFVLQKVFDKTPGSVLISMFFPAIFSWRADVAPGPQNNPKNKNPKRLNSKILT